MRLRSSKYLTQVIFEVILEFKSVSGENNCDSQVNKALCVHSFAEFAATGVCELKTDDNEIIQQSLITFLLLALINVQSSIFLLGFDTTNT